MQKKDKNCITYIEDQHRIVYGIAFIFASSLLCLFHLLATLITTKPKTKPKEEDIKKTKDSSNKAKKVENSVEKSPTKPVRQPAEPRKLEPPRSKFNVQSVS